MAAFAIAAVTMLASASSSPAHSRQDQTGAPAVGQASPSPDQSAPLLPGEPIPAPVVQPPPPPPPPFTAEEADIAAKALSQAGAQGLSPPSLGEDLVAASLAYAKAQHGGRIDPMAADPDWTLRPEPYDPAAAMALARTDGKLAEWFANQPPPLKGYYDLAAARAHYLAIADAGGWGKLPPGSAVQLGSRGAVVAALRQRLAAEGYPVGSAPAVADASAFDPPLDEALRLFQTRHDLAVSGVLDAKTRAALDLPARKIVGIIDANLERWRWAPRVFPPDRIDVNIANEGLTLWRANQVAFTMRVVVGDGKHKTPMLSANARAIEYNPPWIVPARIAASELYPKEAAHPGYLARHGFTHVNGQLVQRAGPLSALGKVKFDLDDPYAIYLHDTPSRKYFARDARDLSHGCIRLDHPVDLAEAILQPQGVTRDQIQAAIDSGATRWVRITPKVPTLLLYETAIGHDDGLVSLHADHYGWDDELNEALRNGGVVAKPAREEPKEP